MFVSKSFSIHLEDLKQIQDRIKEGDVSNVSEFVQQAVKNELKRSNEQ